MSLSADGRTFKSSRTVCPKTRRQHARVYPRATAGVARTFLREVAAKRLRQQPAAGAGRGRPDMVVRLPNDRAVVVDAKASTAAFLEARTAKDALARINEIQKR